MLSKVEQQKSEAKEGRVTVSDLPQREEELSAEDARQVKGTGGGAGGVTIQRKPIGEEIPT